MRSAPITLCFSWRSLWLARSRSHIFNTRVWNSL